jgi:hypothetical protein
MYVHNFAERRRRFVAGIKNGARVNAVLLYGEARTDGKNKEDKLAVSDIY